MGLDRLPHRRCDNPQVLRHWPCFAPGLAVLFGHAHLRPAQSSADILPASVPTRPTSSSPHPKSSDGARWSSRRAWPTASSWIGKGVSDVHRSLADGDALFRMRFQIGNSYDECQSPFSGNHDRPALSARSNVTATSRRPAGSLPRPVRRPSAGFASGIWTGAAVSGPERMKR